MKHKYEQYLKSESKDYKKDFIPIVYWDDDCIEKTFYIDFYVEWEDGTTEWVQAIPHKNLRPIKKYLYAQNIAESHNIVFRGLNEQELSIVSK